MPYLQLVRLPNVFTAVADVLAGYFIVLGPPANPRDLLCLMLASACIYSGGCALNDVRDLEGDLRERPFRPIPSGAVSRRAALILSLMLLAAGWGMTLFVGEQAFWIAGLLVGAVVSYDCFTKDIPVLGSLTMAACRGGNLVLGMSPMLHGGDWWVFPCISMGYVFWLTTLSKFETGGSLRHYPVVIPSGILLVLSVPVWLVVAGYLSAQALIALVALFLMVTPPLLRWIRQPTPAHAGRAVKALVLAIPLLDAVYVLGSRDWTLALPLLLCVLLAVGSARCLYVT